MPLASLTSIIRMCGYTHNLGIALRWSSVRMSAEI
nr:MAG TPA: hypothetical protein [Siphoviridae sp. ctqA315]